MCQDFVLIPLTSMFLKRSWFFAFFSLPPPAPTPRQAPLKVGILQANANPLKYPKSELYSDGFSELFLKAEFEEGDLKKTNVYTEGFGRNWEEIKRLISQLALLIEIELQ